MCCVVCVVFFRYELLNSLAMQLLTKKGGGLLFTCSCSAAVVQNPGKFQDIISQAAIKVGKTAQILTTHSSAADHTVLSNYPENNYFIGCLLRVS
jgi:23S rRNA G2069 N7-methylase RlmK/C1962 C5-methylase RlmI